MSDVGHGDDVDGAVVIDDAFDPAVVDAVRAGIKNTKLLGKSQLVGGFVQTRGFGIACHRAAWSEAQAKAHFLDPFVRAAIDDDRVSALHKTGFVTRLLDAFFGGINALYVNVLVVPPGAAVEKHVDSTLGTRPGDALVYVPRAVCVLYVDVDAADPGGRLRLYDGDRKVAEVAPRPGRLLWFRGSLAHEVTPTTSTRPRVSCVCELYSLPRHRLRLLPRVRLQSEGFADVLQQLGGRPRQPDAAEPLASGDPAQ